MLFTEPRFLVFFLMVLLLTWALRRPGIRALLLWVADALRRYETRKLLLLVASYVFYGAWDERFLGLIALSTVVDWAIGLRLGQVDDARHRRALLVVSLAVNLGLLGLFKYYDFFVHSGAGLLQAIGVEVHPPVLDYVLPVGISFYTFQTLSYTIDVYRRRLAVHRNLLDFALFVSFFPQLVAGPIVRASDFLPQLARMPRFRDIAWRQHLTLFLLGFVKKACVSDNVAPIVDRVFDDPGAYSAASYWLASCLYSVQIYCDFSGYSDMAIATAGMLGYQLRLNFDYPYLASSITDFWRRWHISLSSWFRDYLYIPLGGNRGGAGRTYRNLFVVFFLCGLWHGASWAFVIWGLFHGLFLVLERMGLARVIGRVPRVVAHAYTLLVVLVGWVVFRADQLSTATQLLAGMTGLGEDVGSQAIPYAAAWWGGLGVFALAHVVMGRQILVDRLARLPDPVYAVAWGVAAGLTLPWISTEYVPFIYFQF